MRKTVCLLLVLLSTTYLCCYAQQRRARTSTTAPARRMAAKNRKGNVVPAPTGADSSLLIEWSEANTCIDRYISDPKVVDGAPNYFIVDAKMLSSYLIDAKNLNNIKYLHALLMERIVDSKPALDMAMVGVDEEGNYAYIKNDTVDSVYYALSCLPSLSMSGVETLETPALPMSQVERIKKNYAERMEISDANTLINNYKTSFGSGIKDTTAFSFLINADVLTSYLTSNPNVDYIQFYLGEDHGRLTLVIADIIKDKHIYFLNNHLKYCVLEHVMPCPVCDLPEQGIYLPKPRGE